VNDKSLRRKMTTGAGTTSLVAALVSALALSSAIASSARAASAEDASVHDGRMFAVAVCSACHDVGDPSQLAPTLKQPTPSFREIANRPRVSARSLQRFIAHAHWDEKTTPMTMPDLALSPEQASNVTRYILSLRRPHGN
jgi:mono/diheme cytochrome c family protein